ncbi:P-loop containing nucleoside triphosphate hydrolase protein [Gautieria morchelliformis]|nr:P-loop containing nucleoside triphosphate hydrolase protein [Gautieria morchelliformis]
MTSTSHKRGLTALNEEPTGTVTNEKLEARARPSKAKKQRIGEVWPDYFNDLFKTYKALNTVLGFCSSRKHLATTFPVIRSSVEATLCRPLELNQVAEIKALMPDLIKFAYIPQSEHRINGDVQTHKGHEWARSPTYSAYTSSSVGGGLEDDEHVLILDFVELGKSGARKNDQSYSLPPSLSPVALKKLIEKRNDRFVKAVDELLGATPADESPVEILKAASRDHLPMDPKSRRVEAYALDESSSVTSIPDSQTRPSVEQVLREITGRQSEDYESEDLNEHIGLEWYKGQVAYRKTFPALPGSSGSLDAPLSPMISHAVKSAQNISTLYTHQAAAINAIRQSRNVIVSTSTASGKSIIYQVPLLQFLEADTTATAMLIYPTKALAQDQRGSLERLIQSCDGLQHIKVATYDGDTPQEHRCWIRENASVIFTNFDMLHSSILPHEDLWRRFLQSLKIVAVDELHYYSGLLGTHVAMIIRRFRRVCSAVGNRRFVFVSCSATINDPRHHAQAIFGLDKFEIVTADGAPYGKKDFLVWNPPAIDPLDSSLGHHSPMHEALTLMCYLMKRGIRIILFCKIRKTCELAMKSLRMYLSSEGRTDILDRVMPYRGGYSQQDRRRIEREAFSGNLVGIVATNALELGVDIGVLDAVIVLGFPMGNLASFRQQAGRAGRRARDSLAVLVTDNSPIDRHYAKHPEELFSEPTPDLVVDLENKVVLEAHLQCAGHEMPLSGDDEVYFGPLFREICETRLMKDNEGWYHTHPRYMPYPARHIAIRGIEEERYTVVDVSRVGHPGGEAKILEEVEVSRALFETYEGAVFIHQGLTFIVKEVSHDIKMAKLVRTDVNWVTTPRDFTDIDAIQTYRIREIRSSSQKAFYGRVQVTTTVFGYFKVRGNTILDTVDLDTPPFQHETTGTWVDVPKGIIQLMRTKGLNPAEGIHAAQHAILNCFYMATDLRTECKVSKKEYMANQSSRKRPARLIFYDVPGKSGGVAAKAFDHVSSLVHQAFETVESCPCEEGCVKCVDSPACRERNDVSSKIGAQVILRGVLGLAIDLGAIPDVDPDLVPETVVEAETVWAVNGVRVEVYGSK